MKNTYLKVFITSLVLGFTTAATAATATTTYPISCKLSNIKGHYTYEGESLGNMIHGEAYFNGKGSFTSYSTTTYNCLYYTGGTGAVLNAANNYREGATCSYNDEDLADTDSGTIVKDITSPCEFHIVMPFGTRLASATIRSSRNGKTLHLVGKSKPGKYPFVYRAVYTRE